jgi:serine/threonine protein kinase
MSSVTRPIVVHQPGMTDESAIKAWLDELASGECDQVEFLQHVQERFKSAPDGSWEVLSQLDQYYRRGKIKADVFHAVKTAIAESAMGAADLVSDREDEDEDDDVDESLQSDGLRVADDLPPPRPTAPAEEPVRVADREFRPGSADRELKSGSAGREFKSGTTDRELKPSGAERELEPANAERELKSGSVLRGRYRIEGMLGQGGMGTVFQATDEYRLESEGQRIAIKVLHTAVTMRTELFAELRREFQHLQLLSHPNVVRVFEFDRDGSLAFFTMELLSGVLLSRVLQSRNHIPLKRALALAIIRDVGAGIAHAHSRGVIHGDINPQNIFLTTAGEVRVLDFGASHTRAVIDSEWALPFTTPGYASCQVMEGARPDVRDDVFALACVAYLLLCGRHPFAEKTALEARAERMKARRPPNLSARQWRALRAGLRWEREKRPADVQQWLAQLDLRRAAKHLGSLSELREGPLVKRRGFMVAARIAACVLLLAGGFWIAGNMGLLPSFESLPRLTTARVATPPQASAPAADTTAPNEPASRSMERPAAAAPEPSAQVSRQATPPAKAPVPAPAAVIPSGPSKIELAADTVEVPADEPSAQITVRRKGNLRGEASFIWWTESGTAKPGIDFSPVMPQLARIEDGKSSVSLNVPLSSRGRAREKAFYVVIDHSEGGAALSGRTLTMVTMLPPDQAAR